LTTPAAVAFSLSRAPVRVLDATRDCAGIAAVQVPALAARLRSEGAGAACILGVAHGAGRRADWIDTPHARGWLESCGTGAARHAAAFETALQLALRQGFVAADAAVLARTEPGEALPLLSWDEALPPQPRLPAGGGRPLGLYAIADSAQRLLQLVGAGVATVQLRIKTPAAPDAAWHARLRAQVQEAVSICTSGGAQLFINDHWQVAAAVGAAGLHLGQEDVLAMDPQARAALAASGLALGISSHSLWELCRARALSPRYIACGPVWPTTTKDMPWLPQGLDNLAWWCRMAGAPVVAIGGILQAQQVGQAAAAGADGVCLVRGLGTDPRQSVPALLAALEAGRRQRATAAAAPAWPHPSLPHGELT